jgi:uncharacterized membrane protein
MKYLRYALAVFFIVAGVNHFLRPALYLSVIPAWVPYPWAANWMSGGAEIAGGVGVLAAPLQRMAAWGLIALLLAVFPANVQMALHGVAGHLIPAWVLWGRLPLQAVFVAWVYFSCLWRESDN